MPRQLGFFTRDGFDPLAGQGMVFHQHKFIRKPRDLTLTPALLGSRQRVETTREPRIRLGS